MHLLVSLEHGSRHLRNKKWAAVKGWSLEKDTTGMPKAVYRINANQRVQRYAGNSDKVWMVQTYLNYQVLLI